jgi:hypothetical protein
MPDPMTLEYKDATIARMNGGSFIFFPRFPERDGGDNEGYGTVTVVEVDEPKSGPLPLCTKRGPSLHIPLEKKAFQRLTADVRRMSDSAPVRFVFETGEQGIVTQLTINKRMIIGHRHSHHRDLKDGGATEGDEAESPDIGDLVERVRKV